MKLSIVAHTFVEVDPAFPVLGVRYGEWKLRAGDNLHYADPGYPETDWTTAKGGEDWRTYGKEFEVVNATGWYRQHVQISPALLKAKATVILSLGIVAG